MREGDGERRREEGILELPYSNKTQLLLHRTNAFRVARLNIEADEIALRADVLRISNANEISYDRSYTDSFMRERIHNKINRSK